jgi:hypothetical protein
MLKEIVIWSKHLLRFAVAYCFSFFLVKKKKIQNCNIFRHKNTNVILYFNTV